MPGRVVAGLALEIALEVHQAEADAIAAFNDVRALNHAPVNAAYVERHLGDLARSTDLSRYVL